MLLSFLFKPAGKLDHPRLSSVLLFGGSAVKNNR